MKLLALVAALLLFLLRLVAALLLTLLALIAAVLLVLLILVLRGSHIRLHWVRGSKAAIFNTRQLCLQEIAINKRCCDRYSYSIAG
jgi:hypothetical protein